MSVWTLPITRIKQFWEIFLFTVFQWRKLLLFNFFSLFFCFVFSHFFVFVFSFLLFFLLSFCFFFFPLIIWLLLFLHLSVFLQHALRSLFTWWVRHHCQSVAAVKCCRSFTHSCLIKRLVQALVWSQIIVQSHDQHSHNQNSRNTF